MEIGERIRQRRMQLHMKADDLAELVGVDRATIYRYEKGRTKNMNISIVPELARFLRTTPEYLMGWVDEVDGTLSTEINPTIRMIPIIGTIACGDPILAEQNIEGYQEEVDMNLPKGELFFLRARGDSMMPTVPENSFVLIHHQAEVEQNEIAAVILQDSNEVTLKRVKKQNGIILLVADNPKYDPIVITEKNPARILGKAIKISNNLA